MGQVLDPGKDEHMHMRWIGAICILAGCGGWGFIAAIYHRKKVQILKQFLTMLDYMECELNYRGTQLPQLCRQTAEQGQGLLRRIFTMLAEELDAQIAPNAYLCMASALGKVGAIDETIYYVMIEFAKNLGNFDIHGQLNGLAHAKQICTEQIDNLTNNQESRLRGYKTLGLCAGAAIVILLV